MLSDLETKLNIIKKHNNKNDTNLEVNEFLNNKNRVQWLKTLVNLNPQKGSIKLAKLHMKDSKIMNQCTWKE